MTYFTTILLQLSSCNCQRAELRPRIDFEIQSPYHVHLIPLVKILSPCVHPDMDLIALLQFFYKVGFGRKGLYAIKQKKSL